MSYRSYSQRDDVGRGGRLGSGGGGGGGARDGGGGGGSSSGGGGGSGGNAGEDTPPMSRLFVICNKANTEQEIRDAFEKFGDIEDVWVVQNKQTGENKGVVYIKYAKTSAAAKALEEMNGKVITNSVRPIKVVVASNRNQGSNRCENEKDKYVRLFVLVPKDMAEEELRTEFDKFGDVEHVSLVKDKVTKERRGFAYIRFSKFSHAAEAYEECNAKYKAVFAEPKNTAPRNNLSGGGGGGSGGGVSSGGGGGGGGQHQQQHHLHNQQQQQQQQHHHQHQSQPQHGGQHGGGGPSMMDVAGGGNAVVVAGSGGGGRGGGGYVDQSDRSRSTGRYNDDSYPSSGHNSRFDLHSAFSMPVTSSSNGPPPTEASLSIVCSASLNQDQLWRLFDIIPGLEFCQITGECSRTSNYASAVYNNAEAAAYARDKLHGLEYPPGERLIIKQTIDIKPAVINSAEPLMAVGAMGMGGGGVTMGQVGGGSGQVGQIGAASGGMGQPIGGGGGSGSDNGLFPFDGSAKELFSSVSLPDPEPMADAGAPCAKRCFVVCVPKALPVKVLQNVFSRFGGLIDVYMLQNKNCGYAKYATEESAQAAIECLHRADVCGIKLKVMDAEEPRDPKRKRYEDE